MLKEKEIVLGVTGGNAAYKAAELLRLLVKEAAHVHVVMTRNAQEFVTPLTFQTLSRNPAVTDPFALVDDQKIGHIALADLAELIVILPATVLATTVVPGIHFTGSALQLLLAGVIFGLFNLVVRPIALFLSLPALILTLGLFYFVLNGLLLWLASGLIPGYRVDGLIPGMLGGIVIAVVNWALGALFRDKRD